MKVCLGDFEISNSEIGFSDSDKRRIKETTYTLIKINREQLRSIDLGTYMYAIGVS